MNWPSGTCVASGAIRTRRSSRWARRWQPSTSRHCQPCRAPASRLWQRATGWTVAATSSPSVARQAIACNHREGAITERGQSPRGGNSGTGKTHILCAIGHALIEAGHRVFYARTSDLVQRLQAARRDLVLEAALAKLDTFDLTSAGDPSPGRPVFPPPPRRDHLRPQGSGLNRRPFRTDRPTL
jgi:hypothetical protein